MTTSPVPLFNEMESNRGRLNRLFGDWEPWTMLPIPERMAMPIDIQETEEAILVTVSIPGVKSEDLQVDLERNNLYLRAETKQESSKETNNYHVRERRYGSVERRITLPATVSESKASAVLRDGVLTLTLPKLEKTEIHKIEVKTAE